MPPDPVGEHARSRARPPDRGVALVAAATVLAVISAVALALAHTTIVDQRLTRNALMAMQADALARSGVAVATVALAATSAGGAPDTLASPWAIDVGRQPLGAGWVEVHVEDAARRLDLNAVELADALPRLLATLGLDPGLADAIADWTDPDDVARPHGAERSWYAARTPALVPRNGPLASVDELTTVRDVTPAVLDRLRPYVTVAGEHAVNPNTASREVLLAVIGDPAAVARLVDARQRRALDDDDVGALVGDEAPGLLATRGQRYEVHALAAVGEIRRGVDATVWAPGGAEPSVVAWRPFVPRARAS